MAVVIISRRMIEKGAAVLAMTVLLSQLAQGRPVELLQDRDNPSGTELCHTEPIRTSLVGMWLKAMKLPESLQQVSTHVLLKLYYVSDMLHIM